MSTFATVIGPVDETLNGRVRHFAQVFCEVDDVDIIAGRNIDRFLAWNPNKSLDPIRQYHVREMTKARASASVSLHFSRECLLLTKLHTFRHTLDMEKSIETLQLEYLEVEAWELFESIKVACVYPDYSIRPIELPECA